MRAIAELGDPAYLSLFVAISDDPSDFDNHLAIWDAGLFGEPAVAFLVSKLSSPNPEVRIAAARGLGATRSRKAAAALIDAVRYPDIEVFRSAVQSLAELTHRSFTPNPWVETPSPDAVRRWRDWWLRHGSITPIYGIDDCARPQPLD
jgi:HEAT repeat protein